MWWCSYERWLTPRRPTGFGLFRTHFAPEPEKERRREAREKKAVRRWVPRSWGEASLGRRLRTAPPGDRSPARTGRCRGPPCGSATRFPDQRQQNALETCARSMWRRRVKSTRGVMERELSRRPPPRSMGSGQVSHCGKPEPLRPFTTAPRRLPRPPRGRPATSRGVGSGRGRSATALGTAFLRSGRSRGPGSGWPVWEGMPRGPVAASLAPCRTGGPRCAGRAPCPACLGRGRPRRRSVTQAVERDAAVVTRHCARAARASW